LVFIPVLIRALRIAALILLTLLVPALVALLLLIPGLALVLLIGARWIPALVILVLLIAILPLLVLVLVAVGHSVSPMDDAFYTAADASSGDLHAEATCNQA
jgi:hypothetical protein